LVSSKSSLAVAQKANAELSSQLEKSKKQTEALEMQVQDLKRALATDQAELKDTRAKLRVAETERTQLASKQGEAGETKRALHALEARRKEELAAADLRRREDVRAQERRVGELEKALASEKKRRETAETRLSEMRGKTDGQVERAKGDLHSLEGELRDVKQNLESAESREEQLLSQLEAHRDMLSRVAEEYGRLASTTVSAKAHARVKEDLHTLEHHTFRLERKLSNSEAQVTELTQLIRQVKEDKSIILSQLRTVEWERGHYASASRDLAEDIHPISESLIYDAAQEQLLSTRLDKDMLDTAASIYRSFAHYYFLINRELLGAYRNMQDDLTDEQERALRLARELENVKSARMALTTELQGAREQISIVNQEKAEIVSHLEDAKAATLEVQEQLKTRALEHREEILAQQQALRREKDASQKLASSVSIHKAAEEAVRSELEQ
jgi:chromosome segregation ATPase